MSFCIRSYLDGEAATQKYLEVIERTLENLQKRGYLPQTSLLDVKVHELNPGDWVLIKSWDVVPLTPKYEAPFQVLLTTKTVVQT